MTAPTVFISYSSKNKDWVKNWLLPKIESQGIQTRIDFRDFEIGTPSMINMERAVDECAKTILVFTPEWVNSEWTQFEGLMLMVQDPIGMRKKILPLMLAQCDLPTRLKIFTYADFREKDEWDSQFERMISQIKKDFSVLAPAPAKYPPLEENKIDIKRLPQSPFELFGRQTELNLLDRAWESPNAHVLCFVAYGGVGKTTLINKWLEKMRWDNYRGARRVFAWSFYSQGTGDRVTSADIFIAEALKWFGDPEMAKSNASAWDKGGRLAELVRQEKTLLLLDGMEQLQSYLAIERGKIKDLALEVLVTELARENPGLCVITTRENVADFSDFGTTAQQTDLEQISVEAGRALLRVGGVQGTDVEMEQAASNFGLHALALNLLAAYLHDIPGHHISHAAEIPDLDVPLEKGKHPRRVMAAFANRLGASAEVDVLHILGLFSSPVNKEEIAALRASPPIPGLTEYLEDISDDAWLQVVNHLRRMKLILPESSHRPDTLDCHPLLREHFGEQLKEANPAAWREGNNHLYEYYKSSAKEFPDTLQEMAPLFAAVMHGCQAEKYQEALDEVYWKRIQREKEQFANNNLGVFGAELAALSGFFDPPWRKPVDGLREYAKGLVLASVGYDLRALGRLAEAAQPMQATLETTIAQKDWMNAAIDSSNLSQLYLTLGDMTQSLAYAKQSVDLADRNGDVFYKLTTRVQLADALHQKGHLAEAQVTFREAEEIQKQRQPEFSLLYSLQGFLFCDLLLGQEDYAEVGRRASQTLGLANKYFGKGMGLLDIALDNLSLGRAKLGMSLRGALATKQSPIDEGIASPSARNDILLYLNRAVDGLRQAGTQDYLPRGLLARAEYYRVTGALDKAQKDLDEAFTISTRGGMGLFLADCHLGFARLKVERLKSLNVRTFQLANLQTEIREHVRIAKKMIDEMGYHRRDKEVEELEKLLAISP